VLANSTSKRLQTGASSALKRRARRGKVRKISEALPGKFKIYVNICKVRWGKELRKKDMREKNWSAP